MNDVSPEEGFSATTDIVIFIKITDRITVPTGVGIIDNNRFTNGSPLSLHHCCWIFNGNRRLNSCNLLLARPWARRQNPQQHKFEAHSILRRGFRPFRHRQLLPDCRNPQVRDLAGIN
jgi:hypothetical protein